MDQITVKGISLRGLRQLIESGIFAVPELQREFVWNARKACDLIDSIYRNYPIGTILVWKTDRRNENQLRKRYQILPHFNPSNRNIFFLIDGQQRLSVLWHLLRGEAASVVNAEGKSVNFKNIYFNAYTLDGDHPFVYRERVIGDLSTQLVPAVDLLSSGWRRRLRGHGVRALKRIEQCRRRILNYQAILVFCETNDRTQVRETFVRINSLGMRIGTADTAFARASKFDMRGLVRDVQTRLKHGFDRVQRTTILQTFASALGATDLGARAIDSMIKNLEGDSSERVRFDRAFPALREAFALAADHLVYELGIPSFEFLPSEPMLMILALFFFYNGNVRPSRAAKQRLQQWFWATAVGARYTGRGYRPNLRADAKFMKRLADNPKAHASLKVRLRIQSLCDTEYGRSGPISNAFFCLLRLKRPRYLEDGTLIPLGQTSSRRNSSDKHHIFPRALLIKNGIAPERFNSIVNICYLVARDNRKIGQRAPRNYFEDVPQSRRARDLALRSHLIPSRGGRGIWDRSTKRGFKDLLVKRAWVLARAFERQAGMRLFERGGAI
ncbi:MAG: DUF262 domain-containing protein [Bryobacteraceae bacterium]|jgi:hypothetical protein